MGEEGSGACYTKGALPSGFPQMVPVRHPHTKLSSPRLSCALGSTSSKDSLSLYPQTMWAQLWGNTCRHPGAGSAWGQQKP